MRIIVFLGICWVSTVDGNYHSESHICQMYALYAQLDPWDQCLSLVAEPSLHTLSPKFQTLHRKPTLEYN